MVAKAAAKVAASNGDKSLTGSGSSGPGQELHSFGRLDQLGYCAPPPPSQVGGGRGSRRSQSESTMGDGGGVSRRSRTSSKSGVQRRSSGRGAERTPPFTPIPDDQWVVDPAELNIGRKLGAGAFGTVFKARWRGRAVAVKRLRALPSFASDPSGSMLWSTSTTAGGNGAPSTVPSTFEPDQSLQLTTLSMDAEAVRAFERESDLMRQLPPHRNVLAVLGVLKEPGPGLITELCSKGPLDRYVRKHPLSLVDALVIFADVCSGLAHLHAHRIVHRDLAARNLLQDSKRVVKICDFGLARDTARDGYQTLTEEGPLRWMAPEALEHRQYSRKSDIYSLGITMWELLAAKKPYYSMTPAQASIAVVAQQLRPPMLEGWSPALYEVMSRCWHADREQRPDLDWVESQLRGQLADVKRANLSGNASGATRDATPPSYEVVPSWSSAGGSSVAPSSSTQYGSVADGSDSALPSGYERVNDGDDQYDDVPESMKSSKQTCKACQFHPDTKVYAAVYGDDDSRAYVAVNPVEQLIVVAFRGTVPTDWRNWLLNFRFTKTQYLEAPAGVSVHHGWYEGYLSLQPQLHSALRRALAACPKCDVLVTGHSLGAALASFAVLDIAKNFTITTKFQVYTYGMPRVGNAQFAQWVNRTIGPDLVYRVVHRDDPVVHVPAFLQGFRHIAQEVWFNQQMTYYYRCDKSGEDPHCSDSVSVTDWDVMNHIYYYNIHVGTDCALGAGDPEPPSLPGSGAHKAPWPTNPQKTLLKAE